METDEKLITAIFSIGRMIKEKTFNTKPGALSHLQFQCLHFIQGAHSPTMSSVASFLFVKRPTATAIIEQLFKDKVITREKDPTDRRIVRLKLTLAGEKLLKDHRKKLEENLKNIFKPLKEIQKQKLSEILTDIITSQK